MITQIRPLFGFLYLQIKVKTSKSETLNKAIYLRKYSMSKLKSFLDFMDQSIKVPLKQLNN